MLTPVYYEQMKKDDLAGSSALSLLYGFYRVTIELIATVSSVSLQDLSVQFHWSKELMSSSPTPCFMI